MKKMLNSYKGSLMIRLTVTLVAMLGLVVIFIGALSAIQISNGLSSMETKMQTSVEDLSKVLHKSLEKDLDNILLEKSLEVDSIVDSLTNDAKRASIQIKSLPNLNNGTTEEIESFIATIKSAYPEFENVYLGKKEGTFLIGPRPNNVPVNYNPTKTNWYLNTKDLKDGEVYVTDAYTSADNSGLMVTISTPYFNNGVFEGVVGIDISLKGLSTLIGETKVSENSLTMVTDTKGTIISHTDLELIGKDLSELEDNRAEKLSDDKTKLITKSKVNESTNWSSYVMQPSYELNANMESLNKIIEGTTAKVSDIKETVFKDYAKLATVIFIVTLIVVIVASYFVSRGIVIPIIRVLEVTNDVSNGDLRRRVTGKYKGEIQELANSVNSMTNNLNSVVLKLIAITRTISDSTELIDKGMIEVSESNKIVSESMDEVSVGSTNQNERMIDISELFETIEYSLAGFNESLTVVVKETSKLDISAKEGVKVLGEINHKMYNIEVGAEGNSLLIQSLADKIKQVREVTSTIENIAEQTNLLSLNASIEAARAGEQGKGFAVVAQEVRKLAEQSKESVKSIGEVISDVIKLSNKVSENMGIALKDVKEGSKEVNEVTDYFKTIIDKLNNLTFEMGNMSGKSDEIINSTKSVSSNVSEVVSISEQTTASTEEVSATVVQQQGTNDNIIKQSSELKSISKDLKEELNKFKVDY